MCTFSAAPSKSVRAVVTIATADYDVLHNHVHLNPTDELRCIDFITSLCLTGICVWLWKAQRWTQRNYKMCQEHIWWLKQWPYSTDGWISIASEDLFFRVNCSFKSSWHLPHKQTHNLINPRFVRLSRDKRATDRASQVPWPGQATEIPHRQKATAILLKTICHYWPEPVSSSACCISYLGSFQNRHLLVFVNDNVCLSVRSAARLWSRNV